MAAVRVIRFLRRLLDVDATGIADGDVPTWNAAVSKFTMAAPSAVAAHSVTISGNTAGVPALIATGTWTLAGGNNITLSQAGNAVTISGGPGSVAESQTAISGISASDTLYTSGTVRISGVGGGITVSSNTGQRIDLSVAAPVAQTLQTQNVIDLTLDGNTAGALALMSSGTVSLAGGQNITLSQNGNAVTISGASFSQSVQPETQTFVGGISASDTLYTSGSIRLTGVGGGITVSSNTGQRVDLSVAAPVAQTVQTQNVVDLTLSGNTAGALALVSSGTLTLAGGNNITVSQAGNAVTISGPSIPAESQTFIAAISASDTLYTSGSVRFTGSQAVTVRSGTGQLVVIDAPVQSVQPETQTFVGGVSASDTLYTSGTVRITGVGGGITVSSNTGQRIDLSVAAQSVQPETQTFVGGVANSQTTYTSGTVSLSELGAVTIRSTTGNQFQISVNAQSVQPETQTFVGGISASDTLYTSGTVRLTGVGGGVTVSTNTGQRVDISVAAQSVQPETQTFIGGVSASDTLYTSGTVRLTGVGGGITVSTNTGQRVDLSVAAQTNQAGSVYAISNTSGTSSGTYDARTLSIAGAGIVTVAASNSGWRINASQSVQAGSVYAISNTSGTSSGTYDARTLSIAGAGIVTVAASNSGWRINASQSVQTQNLVDVTLAGNSTSAGGGFALISSGTMTLAGGNNVTLSQNGNAVTISAASQSVQAETQTFIGGIRNSETTYTSGTVNLSAVGGPITIRSTTGNAFQFSVSQSVQPETQTAISGIANSETTYTSGTVSLSELGAVTIRSTTGNQFQISVNAQSVQPETQTFIAGIQNSETTYTSGSVKLSVVGGPLTIRSTTGNAFQFSASQSVQPETQTAVSGIANSQTTYTSGTVSLSELGAITIRSTTGNQFQLSVNSQTVQTQNLHNVTLSGNSTSAGAGYIQVSSGTLTLAGGNNITLSQNGNAITISGPNAAGAQTGISGLANSQTTYTSGTVSFSEQGALTIRSTTGNQFQFSVPATSSLSATGDISISTNGSTVSIGMPPTLMGVSTGGNTAGDTGVTKTRMVFVGSNNITLSQATGAAGGTISFVGAAGAAATAISGLANSETTYTSGTVSLSELGAITIRSTTGNQFQLSVNAQTNQSGNVYASSNTFGTSSGTYDARSISIAGRGEVSVAASNSGWIISSPVQTEQTQSRFNLTLSGNSTSGGAGYIQISSGVMTLAGGNNITLSQAGNAVTVSAAGGPETQVAISGIRASDTTYTSGSVTITGVGGGVTVNSNTGQRVDISVAAPVAQTNQSGNVYASSNTFGTSSGTYDARSISIAGRGAVSVAASNSGWIVSAPVQTAQTGISGISNSNTTYTSGTIGLSELGAITIRSTTGNQFQFSVNSQTVQTQNIMQVTASGNRTSGGGGYVVISTGTMALAGGPNVTLSQDANTISISAGAGGGGVAIAGSNTTYTSGTASFTGVGGGVTVSSNTGQRIDISVAAPVAQTNQAGSLYAISNTSGTSSGTYDARTLSIAGNGPITVAASNSGFRIDAPATSLLSGTGGINISTNGSTISIGFTNQIADWENMAMGNAQLMTHVSGNSKQAFFWRDNIVGDITAKSLAMKISMVTASQPLSVSVHLGVYTLANSTSANRLASHSEAFVISSATSVSLSGVRNLIMTGIGTHATLSTMSHGDYLLALMFSATATNAMNFSLYGASTGGGPLGGLYPGTNNFSAGTSQGVQAMAGRLSTTVNAMPANVVASDLVNQGQGASMQLHPWIYIRS